MAAACSLDYSAGLPVFAAAVAYQGYCFVDQEVDSVACLIYLIGYPITVVVAAAAMAILIGGLLKQTVAEEKMPVGE